MVLAHSTGWAGAHGELSLFAAFWMDPGQAVGPSLGRRHRSERGARGQLMGRYRFRSQSSCLPTPPLPYLTGDMRGADLGSHRMQHHGVWAKAGTLPPHQGVSIVKLPLQPQCHQAAPGKGWSEGAQPDLPIWSYWEEAAAQPG